MAFTLGTWWVALPFILKRLGGSEADVGNVFAAQMGCYALGCMIAGTLLGHFHPQRILLLGVPAMTLLASAMCFVLLWPPPENFPLNQVGLLIILFGLTGMFMSFFWPFIMAWISTGHEGRDLNKRLGCFNISFSSGGLLSPWLGGYLVEKSSLLPLVLAVTTLALCFLALCLAGRYRQNNTISTTSENNLLPDDINKTLLPTFRRIARIGLLFSCICFGIVRTQLGLLFKYELNFSETDFGMVITIFSAANFVLFAAAGRWHFWHYRPGFLAGAEAILILSVLLILLGGPLWVFFVIAIALGNGYGFVYSSHLYYGVSGGKRRSARMAIHEITLSTGIVIGSLMGGYLSEHVGPYMPYWFALAAMVVCMTVQGIVWFISPPHGGASQIRIQEKGILTKR